MADSGDRVKKREGGGGAYRGLSGALLHPSQPRVRGAFRGISSGTCAKIALQTSAGLH